LPSTAAAAAEAGEAGPAPAAEQPSWLAALYPLPLLLLLLSPCALGCSFAQAGPAPAAGQTPWLTDLLFLAAAAIAFANAHAASIHKPTFSSSSCEVCTLTGQ
jgi:hypothetical protein